MIPYKHPPQDGSLGRLSDLCPKEELVREGADGPAFIVRAVYGKQLFLERIAGEPGVRTHHAFLAHSPVPVHWPDQIKDILGVWEGKR